MNVEYIQSTALTPSVALTGGAAYDWPRPAFPEYVFVSYFSRRYCRFGRSLPFETRAPSPDPLPYLE